MYKRILLPLDGSALAEEAPMDDKADTATEGTVEPAGDAPDKSAESTEDKG